MSAETKAELEAALQAHLTDESPDNILVTGYLYGASLAIFDEGNSTRHTYWFDAQDNQPPHVTRGLADMLSEWSCGTTMSYSGDDD